MNTQSFGTVAPEPNRSAEIDPMRAPFNAPAAGASASMDGFVEDHVDAFRVQMERLERDRLGEALAWEGSKNGSGPAADARTISHREAHEHFQRIGTSMFPGVTHGRSRRG